MKKLKFISTISLTFLSALAMMINAQSISTRDFVQTITEFVPCANGGAGEVVEGDVGIHIVVHFNKAGDVTKFHAQPQGGTLVGQTTGTRFQATGVTQDNSASPNGAMTYSFVNRFHFVGRGGIQFGQYDNYHITVNANGDITALVDKSSIFCK
ncbi:MAG: hypothetical protein HKN76_05470 [Saprospiraceae bacterium]|nr:hypothetical protein [Saprospiraceae bacterium]